MDKVLIAGGGIAGLATALAVAQAGREALVLEQAETFREVGAGIQLGPSGRRALEALGAWEALPEKVFRPRAIRIRRAATGKDIGVLPLGEAFRARFGRDYQTVHRGDLLAALLARARETPGIVLKTGWRADVYSLTPTGVILRSADGREEAGEALIGADGIRSAVRAQLLLDGPPRFAGHVLYRALTDAADLPAETDAENVNLWLHPGGHVVHYPVSGGRRFNIVAAVNEARGEGPWSAPSDGAILRRVFAGVSPELEAVLALPGSWLRWAGADRPAAGVRGEGPVSLVGDAAHPTLPYLASGAVMALEDAATLGGMLRRDGGGDIARPLRACERARAPRTARIVRTSRALAGVYHAGPPLSFLRDQFIRLHSGPRGAERMAWLYDWRP